MPMFLVSSVCDEGVSDTSFTVVAAESRLAVAADMLADPWRWKRFLERTKLWWELTYHEYKYGEPRGWSAADLLREIDRTWIDGDSTYEVRIHEIKEVRRLQPEAPAPHVVEAGGQPG
ncbi:MAG: hypothetical protein K2W96_02270 [Gemmataceae bacterium]|nr:hypothetical protein [Gemmataceae bacterium]